MRQQWKRKQKMAAAAITAGAMALCLTGGNVSFLTDTAYAYQVNVYIDADMNQAITGANNPAEKIYTWYQIDDQEEMDQLFDNYQYYDPNWKKGDTIPIMIVGNVQGHRTLFCSPGEGNTNAKVGDRRWVQDGLKDYLCGGHIMVFSNTNFDSYWYNTSYNADNMEGWGEVGASGNTAVITRGCGGCWFLEKRDVPVQVKTDTVYSLPYELHTYKQSGREFVSSDNYMVIRKKSDYDDYSKVEFIKPESANAWGYHGWQINRTSGNKFKIINYNLFDEGACLLFYGNTLKQSQNIPRWQLHMYIADERISDQNNKRTITTSTKWYHENYWRVRPDFPGDNEEFEIWYGVPGVSRGEMTRVDADQTVTPDVPETEMQKVTYLSDSTDLLVGSGTSRGLSPGEVYYIGAGSSLKVESGATLIVGRNCVLINNGIISNYGKIIIQPGGVIMTLDAGDTEYCGILTGDGDLVIRHDGKLKVKKLSITGDFYNSGVALVTEVLEPGRSYCSDGGALYAGGNYYKMNFINKTADVLSAGINSGLITNSNRSTADYEHVKVMAGDTILIK